MSTNCLTRRFLTLALPPTAIALYPTTPVPATPAPAAPADVPAPGAKSLPWSSARLPCERSVCPERTARENRDTRRSSFASAITRGRTRGRAGTAFDRQAIA